MRDEREARARFLLGRLLADIYRDECAAELLRDALSYLPGMAEAHVELGVVYSRLERYEVMLGAFRDAIRLDEQTVREAAREEPAELEALRWVLYAERPEPAPAGGTAAVAVPGYVRETWALVSLGSEHLQAGRDGKAIDALEAALKLDGTHEYAAVLLSLAYLLTKEGKGMLGVEAEGSVLWEVKPALAELLFGGQEGRPAISQ